MPILPTVLVNGAEGIGTGWSTSIPNFNPSDIVANLRRMLDGEQPVPMKPWYRGFKGTIEEVGGLHVHRALLAGVGHACVGAAALRPHARSRLGQPMLAGYADAWRVLQCLSPSAALHPAWLALNPCLPVCLPAPSNPHPGAHQDQRQVIPDLRRHQPAGRHHAGDQRAAHPQVDPGCLGAGAVQAEGFYPPAEGWLLPCWQHGTQAELRNLALLCLL